MFSGAAMKRLAIAIAIALIGTRAFAADMAVKAPPPAPAPVYNWTGWYAGVNAGGSFGNVKTDFNIAPITVGTSTIPGFASSNTEHPSGFMGGGQVGYNWQFSPIWVVGLEADFQGALEKDSNNLSTPFNANVTFLINNTPPPICCVLATGTAVTNYTTRIDWFGTVRGRFGYLWGNGQLLSYVTGGLAYGHVDVEGTTTISGSVGLDTFSVTHPIGHSQVNAGWVAGFGTEGRLWATNWTWKIEGLYMDLGHLNDTDAAPVATGGQVITGSHFTDTIFRGGLNYQFPPPVIKTRG
jgi:outer membrane immunogenic protein